MHSHSPLFSSTGLVAWNADGVPGSGPADGPHGASGGTPPGGPYGPPSGAPVGGPYGGAPVGGPYGPVGGGPTGSGPTVPGGPSFQKPEGAIYHPAPPPGYPGAPVPVGGTYELASWWSRVAATLVDWLILLIPFIPLVFIVFAITGVSFTSGSDEATGAAIVGAILAFFALMLVYTVVALLYAPYFMAKWDGATPGKRMLGIRVVRAEGLPLTFWYAAYREVVVKYLLFGFASSFSLGIASLVDYLWPLWDSEQRSLHDIIVNTRVVRA